VTLVPLCSNELSRVGCSMGSRRRIAPSRLGAFPPHDARRRTQDAGKRTGAWYVCMYVCMYVRVVCS
jgi:hypothetical protein